VGGDFYKPPEPEKQGSWWVRRGGIWSPASGGLRWGWGSEQGWCAGYGCGGRHRGGPQQREAAGTVREVDRLQASQELSLRSQLDSSVRLEVNKLRL